MPDNELTAAVKNIDILIHELETKRDALSEPDNEILIALGSLYKQRNKLEKIAIEHATQDYKNAADKIKDAAQKTKAAVDSLQKTEKAMADVTKAVAAVEKLVTFLS